MSRTYCYMPAGLDKQDKEDQECEILNFASDLCLGQIEFISETIVGKTKIQERDLGRLIDKLSSDDVLIVSDLSYLGQSLLEVLKILQILFEREIVVYSISVGSELDFNFDPKALAFVINLAGEIEKGVISKRTKEALARKKAEGFKLGRPVGSTSKSKLEGKEGRIKELIGHKVAKAAIARMLGVSRITLLNFIKSQKLE